MKPKEHYVFIPESTLLCAEFKAIKPHARLLYAYLICKRAGKDDWFTYPYKAIRDDSGYRYETISKCIKQLAKAGFMEYQHGGLEQNRNKYYLIPSWLTRE
jgi:hypothetical protein